MLCRAVHVECEYSVCVLIVCDPVEQDQEHMHYSFVCETYHQDLTVLHVPTGHSAFASCELLSVTVTAMIA